jgi:hypothetical protein
LRRLGRRRRRGRRVSVAKPNWKGRHLAPTSCLSATITDIIIIAGMAVMMNPWPNRVVIAPQIFVSAH